MKSLFGNIIITILFALFSIHLNAQCTSGFSIKTLLLEDTIVEFNNNADASYDVYIWDFGDGTLLTEESKNHQDHKYSAYGTYTVCLIVVDTILAPDDICKDTFCLDVTIEDPAGIASPEFTFLVNDYLLSIQNTTSGNYDEIVYDFGNGHFYNSSEISHVYADPGIYLVTQTVYNAFSQHIFNYSKKVVVKEDLIECASFFQYQLDSLDNYSVHFTNQSICNNQQHFWDFGNGSYSSLENPTHTYPFPGNYKVTLSVRNSITGQMHGFEQTIRIKGNQEAYKSDFQFFNKVNYQTIYFESTSLGNDISNYLWDFGDGDTSIMENPVKVYSSPGYYEVCLTTSNDDFGTSNIFCQTVPVGNPEKRATDFAFLVDPIDQLVYFNDNNEVINPSVSFWQIDDVFIQNENSIEIPFENRDYIKASLQNESSILRTRVKIAKTDLEDPSLYSGFISLTTNSSHKKDGGGDDGEVIFKGSTSGDISFLHWDFGDGKHNYSSIQPIHTFDNLKTYEVCLTVTEAKSGNTHTSCEEITLTTTGIESEELSEENLLIYPNPADNQVHFQLNSTNEKVSIRLLDLSGKIIEIIVDGRVDVRNEIVWQCSHIENGWYLIQVFEGNKLTIEKIVISR